MNIIKFSFNFNFNSVEIGDNFIFNFSNHPTPNHQPKV